MKPKSRLAWRATYACLAVSFLLLPRAGNGQAAAPKGLGAGKAVFPKVTLQADVVGGDEGDGAEKPSRIFGKLSIKGWHPQGGHCLYFPYLDPDYGSDRAITRRQELFADKHGRQVFDGGATKVTVEKPALSVDLEGKTFLRLEPSPEVESDPQFDDLTLTFDSRIPRLFYSSPDEWFYDGYAPRLMETCPADANQAARAGLLPSQSADLTYRVKLPDGWDFVGPGALTATGDVFGTFVANQVAFAVMRKVQRLSTDVAGVHVEVVFRTPGFLAIMDTMERTLPLLVQMFGEFPYKSLSLVETSELQRFGLPGLIAVNRPGQSFFDRVQSDWMNWLHWVVVSQTVKQWWGGLITARLPEDEWLIAGIAEAATLEALSHDQVHFNLFAASDTGSRLLSLTYLQVAEVTAATLRRMAPFATPTQSDFQSKSSLSDQNPLLFVKQSEALRQMRGLTGEAAYFGFMRQLTGTYLHRSLSPKEYLGFLGRMPSPFPPAIRHELQDDLKQWWTNQGWPDFDLDEFKVEELPDGRWLTQVSARQLGSIDFPPLFGIVDVAGKTHLVRAERRGKADGEPWKASLTTPNRPIRAVVDPDHEVFDADRFNNSSDPPGLTFFPGGADTLRDDAYTVVWFPYFYRLPALPFSIGLQAVVFRYIQNGLFLKIEGAPKEKVGGGEIRQRFQFHDSPLSAEVDAVQNYSGDRQIEAGLTRGPLFDGEPNVSATIRTRHKQRVGEPDTRHQSIVAGLSIRSSSALNRCRFSLSGEHEKVPPGLAHGFDYDRSIGLASGDCLITPRSGIGTRGFYGVSKTVGLIPDQALFRPTEIKEGRLRLDDKSLPLTSRLATIGTDLVLPFYLPLRNDSMLMTRQLRWRIFYDVGRDMAREVDFKSGGGGFTLPFGGDLAGAGSLSITKMTLLAILYSDVGGVVSRRPSIVFDLSGDL